MIIDLAPLLAAAKKVEKAWGFESWLCNTEKYCAKILEIAPGWQCSDHYHPIKTETFIVLRGLVQFEFIGSSDKYRKCETLKPGDRRDIPSFSGHRFGSINGATILEISTKHSDDDVERMEESKPL